MIIEKQHLLDCTFRDGGYYNNWNFSIAIFKKYLKFISLNKIDAIEVGFRSPHHKDYYGEFAFCHDNFLNKFSFPKNTDICVMINCSDFISKNLSDYFKEKKKSKISIIRIACHEYEIFKAIKMSKLLKIMGYRVFINLMQINNIKKFKLINFLKKLNKNSKFIEVVYFADSFGALIQKDVAQFSKLFKNIWKNEFGVHMHDNKSRAFSNSINAIKNNCSWVDSTLLGMGRGAGNAKTEKVYSYIKNIKIKKKPKTLFDHFSKLKIKYNWGPSTFYKMAANNNVHPTYVQSLVSDIRYNNKDKILILKKLSKDKYRKFDPDTIPKIYSDINKINNYNNNSFFIKKNFKERKILLIGQKKITKIELKKIFIYITKHSPILIGLNYNKFIPQKFFDYIIISNEKRAVFDQIYYNKITKPIITTKKIYKKFLGKNQKVILYDLKIKKNKLNIYKNNAILNENHVFSYTLAFLISKKILKFVTAGFESDMIYHEEYYKMKSILNKFTSKYNKLNISKI